MESGGVDGRYVVSFDADVMPRPCVNVTAVAIVDSDIDNHSGVARGLWPPGGVQAHAP
jgi:hypothetical protein